ncbi:MAG: GTP cyclohydrolase II [Pseudomonadota bacterium]
MSLAPTTTEMIARARSDLRLGVPVVIDGYLVLAVETLSDERLRDVCTLGPPVVAITQRRAETLKARPYDGDLARVVLPKGADAEWVHALADPAKDLSAPMKGPLATEREGDPIAHRAAIALCKAARLLPSALVLRLHEAAASTQFNDLTHLAAPTIVAIQGQRSALSSIVSARVPLEVAEQARLHVFRPDDGAEEHYAIEIGRPDRNMPVLARLHSACFTGDLLGSLKCDCGPQLRGALSQMGNEGAGILLYLNQEGRGIGLANKMRAYALQDQGFDTVEANHRLGFEDDERDFRLGADLLKTMGFSSVRLLTNNPAKIAMMEKCGVAVTERVPLRVGETEFNHGYLATKAAKSGHLL